MKVRAKQITIDSSMAPTGSLDFGSDASPFSNVYADNFQGNMTGAIRFKAKNETGSTINKGVPVYISGLSGSGDVPTVALADADGVGTMPAVGLTESSANNNAEVYIVSFGNLGGLNTSGFSVGDSVFIGTTPGTLVLKSNVTGSSAKLQNIGQVIRSHADSGIIKVGGAGRTAATPNLDSGHIFIGDSNVSTQSSYEFPTSIGTSGYVLASDGTNVTFQQQAGSELIDDTTPQLGGDLDLNGNSIVSVSGGNIVLDSGALGGYIDLKSSGTSGDILLRPSSVSAGVGIGAGFTPGSVLPDAGVVLNVKDSRSLASQFITSIENTDTGTAASLLKLKMNTTSSVASTNNYIAFYNGTSKDGFVAGDGAGGLTVSTKSNSTTSQMTLSSPVINMSYGATEGAAMDNIYTCLYIGDIPTSFPDGGQALRVKETTAGSFLCDFTNTYNSDVNYVVRLQGGATASSTGGTLTRFLAMFAGDGTALGYLRADGSGGVELVNAFTGRHPSLMPSYSSMKLGMIVESTGELWANDQDSVSTAIPKVVLSNTNNSKKVFGVVSSLSSEYEGYAEKWGVQSGENQITVNSIGEGKILVSNINGEIENGDYITTSEIQGYGRLQDDDLLHNYTVAKCTENIDWANVSETIELNGVEYKVYLSGCTYHCG